METRATNLSIVLFSLFVAFLLATIPLSNTFNLLRPEWVLLVLLYWLIALPERIGLSSAWVVGLLLDFVEGSLLGQHAMTFVIAAFFAVSLHQQFRMFSRTQQTLLIAFAVAIYELIDGLIAQFSGQASFSFSFFLPVLFSALMWPFIFTLLQRVRR